MRRARWNQKAVPAVANDIAAAGNARRNDRQTGKCGLKECARQALAIFGREREDVGEAEQCRYILSWTDRHYIGGVVVNLALGYCERPLALARSHEQKAHARSRLVDQSCRLEQRRDFLPGHARYGDDDLGRTETKLVAEWRRRRPQRQRPLEPVDVDG